MGSTAGTCACDKDKKFSPKNTCPALELKNVYTDTFYTSLFSCKSSVDSVHIASRGRVFALARRCFHAHYQRHSFERSLIFSSSSCFFFSVSLPYLLLFALFFPFLFVHVQSTLASPRTKEFCSIPTFIPFVQSMGRIVFCLFVIVFLLFLSVIYLFSSYHICILICTSRGMIQGVARRVFIKKTLLYMSPRIYHLCFLI